MTDAILAASLPRATDDTIETPARRALRRLLRRRGAMVGLAVIAALIVGKAVKEIERALHVGITHRHLHEARRLREAFVLIAGANHDYGGERGKAMVQVKDALRLVDEYVLKNGRRLYVLGECRLINLAAAHGHPASVMDMSFAAQALATEWSVSQRGKLEPKVYNVPKAVDQWVATLKLQTMGITIDTLTDEQRKYLSSWEMGT